MQRCEIFSIFLLRIVVVMVRLGDSHITVYADMHTSDTTVKIIITSLCEILNIIIILINTDRVYIIVCE